MAVSSGAAVSAGSVGAVVAVPPALLDGDGEFVGAASPATHPASSRVVAARAAQVRVARNDGAERSM